MAALTVEFPQTVWTVEFGGDEIVVAPVTMAPGAPGGGGGGAVDSVNGQTGVVVLDAGDVGALDASSGYNTANGWLKLDGSGTAPDSTLPASIARDSEVTSAVSAHAAATDPHGDRAYVDGLTGTANGIAELDSNGFVPSAQLPSYVDDVVEAANLAALPGTGETGKIYVTLDNNLTFRWSGSAYVEISASLALGETSSTAYRGDRGKTAYDHSQVTGNPHGTTAADVGAQPADADLTTIAGLTPSNDDFVQRKAGAWTNRTIAQVKADLGVSTPEWTVIAERDISSTSASERFDSTTNADPTSYKELRLSIVGQCVDTASSQTQIGLRLNNDTGWSNYLWAETTRGGGASTLSQTSGSSFYIGKLASQLTNSTRAGLIDVAFSAISTSWRHPIRSDFAEEDSNSTNQIHYLVGMLGGAHIGTGAITRVDVFPLSGSGFAAGTRIRLSGRA